MRLSVPLATTSQKVSTYRLRRRLSDALTIILFLLPSLILFVLFVLVPVVQAAHYSLYKWNGLGSLDDYIGLKNYQILFNDPVFVQAIKNNFLIAILSLLLQLPLAIALALLINRKLPGRTFFRMVFFLPYVLAPVVIGLIWAFIYNPQNGLITGLLHQFSPLTVPPAYLANRNTVLYAVFAAITWEFFGFHLVLYMAGLQNIPEDVIEAARVDGANSRQVIRHITLPLLGSTIRLSAFLSILGSLQYFDLIYVMTFGGPVNASQVMAMYQYHFGLQEFRLGYGSAVGVVMFGLCFIFALLYQRLIMRQDLTGSSAL
ncbi:MAG TPA: sugar ABC transporter permease [Ktedonobacterales bacterium]|nr:sugar ABC transporter permease [Ktedonobacterales bacterium]